jgi:hypothetical protein
VFEQTRRELAAAVAADLSLLPTSVLGDEMRELRRIELEAVAQRLRRLEVFDRLHGCVDDGQVTSAAWSRTELGLSHSAATTEVSVARVRRTCPQLAATFDTGRTSFRHLQVAAAAMRRLNEPEIWTQLDERIAGWAQETSAREYAEMLDALVEQLGPEPKPKDRKQHEQRRFAVTSGFNGMVNVSGRLTPEVGEKLHAALSAASRPDVDGEIRTTGQRKADALDHILDTVLDTALLPVDGGEKPHITLLVPLDELAEDERSNDEPAAGELFDRQPFYSEPSAAQRAAVAAAAAEALDRRPRFSWTGPASRAAARRLSCDGILLPIFTRGGEPIDVGRRTRVVSAPLRALIVARDRHCQWSGCQIPARWCEVHHVHHWRDSGTTDRRNLILLCDEHHRAAHSGQFVVVLHAAGKITVRPRAGNEPYYEIRSGPPPGKQPQLLDLLTTAARHLRSA